MHDTRQYTPASRVRVAPFRRRLPVTLRDLYAFSIGSAYAVAVALLLRFVS